MCTARKLLSVLLGDLFNIANRGRRKPMVKTISERPPKIISIIASNGSPLVNMGIKPNLGSKASTMTTIGTVDKHTV
jgi:hypothetical protein